MEFLHPKLLWIAVIIPLLAAYYIFVGRRGATLSVTTLGGRRAPRTLRYWLRPLPIVLRLGAMAMFIVALARPISESYSEEVTVEGVDIVLAIDSSSSMLAQDFDPNRLESAKQMAASFVADRENDRFSLVTFAGEAYSLTPLTVSHADVQTMLGSLRCGVIDDGTAIGNGLATALNRLRDSDATSKVVVLLTDGVNNSGQISPMMAADIAHDMGVKLYTIGVGSEGEAPYPVQDYFGNYQLVMTPVEIDEALLDEMAAKTGGKYFRATDKKALESIYEEINELEKSEVQVAQYYHHDELYERWLVYGLLLLAAEFLVRRLILNRLP